MTNQTDQDLPYPVTKSIFAARSGRTKSSITEAAAGPLREACLPGGRIDARHPCVLSWCAKRGIDPGVLLDVAAVKPQAAAAAAPRQPETETASVDDALLDLTLREICDRFGSLAGFSDFLSARKKIADTEARELKNAEQRDLVVPRGPIHAHVFGAFRLLAKQLLEHAPRTIVVRLFSACRSGATDQEGIAIVLAIVKPVLRSLETSAVKVLGNGV